MSVTSCENEPDKLVYEACTMGAIGRFLSSLKMMLHMLQGSTRVFNGFPISVVGCCFSEKDFEKVAGSTKEQVEKDVEPFSPTLELKLD